MSASFISVCFSIHVLPRLKEDMDSEKRKRKLQDPAAQETVKQRKLENQVCSRCVFSEKC